MTTNTTFEPYPSYISQFNSMSPVNSTSSEMSQDDLVSEYDFWGNTEFEAPHGSIAMLPEGYQVPTKRPKHKPEAAGNPATSFSNFEFVNHQLGHSQRQQPVANLTPFITYAATPSPVPTSPLQASIVAIPSPPSSNSSPTATNFPALYSLPTQRVMIQNNNPLQGGIEHFETMSKPPKVAPTTIPFHSGPTVTPFSRQSSVDPFEFSIPCHYGSEYDPSIDLDFHAKIVAEEDKRRRNTAASARFRVKKKMREQALEKTAKDMTIKAEMLDNRVKELELEVKWLRSLIVEKDARLLDIERPNTKQKDDDETESDQHQEPSDQSTQN